MSSTSAYDYICVIDFEATCIDGKGKEFYPHEIIEFPAVLIDVLKREIVSTFHSFVRPTLNPVLSDFCKNLTGISQASVNDAETFDYVLSKFLEWINNALPPGGTFIILTDGSWDVNKFLNLQCLLTEIDFPQWAIEYIDIKCTYKHHTNCKIDKVRLYDMLHFYDLSFEGKLHSGKDDAYNIARVVLAMMESGCDFIANAYYLPGSTKGLKRKLATYLKEKKRNKSRSNRLRKKGKLSGNSNVVLEEPEMDIDPDLIGCESVLMKYKHM